MPRRFTLKIVDLIADALLSASRVLPVEVEKAIKRAEKEESGKSQIVLKAICDNIEAAREQNIPLCQDTGMVWCMAEIGRESSINLPLLEKTINLGVKKAVEKGYFRRSVVTDPIYKRKNTNTNLPPIINYMLVPGRSITLRFLLKGFGSENMSGVRMLNPTAGEEGVINAVVDMVKKAGSSPCPPLFLGIGIGGTLDSAALLSKRALFKEGRENTLEKKIKERVNELGIGAGGLGGVKTALSVRVMTMPTHIAGLPVALTINCWAERKAEVILLGGIYEEN